LPPPGVENEAVTLPPAAPPAEAGPVPARAEVPGYEILTELGRGGMGVVYQARQIMLNRVVALKMVLGGGHADEANLARFRTEAEAVARLQHPNIVQVFEVGENGGLPFFSLEYCPGGSLDKKLSGTPLPPGEAAALVEQLAWAMHAAHTKGVLHRDLKPANVLLAEDGTPKVTDFGLAKKLGEAGRTATGAVMGTPSYMAPEQAGGNKEIGPAADVYALGAILYECLTGRPPFKAATLLDTLAQVLADDPVPPRRLQPKVPRDLETVCLKCLHKEPARRYASAEALADDLRRFLAGEPIAARPVGWLERVAKWARRRPTAAALLGVSLLAASALATLGGLWYSAQLGLAYEQSRLRGEEARHERVAAEQERQRVREVEGLLAQVRGEKDRAERQTRLARDRLQHARRTAYALQLMQIDALSTRTPAQGLSLLANPTRCPADLREFTWGHLVHRCQRKRRLFSGFVSDLALAPDGRTVAAVCWEDGEDEPVSVATLWQVGDGRWLRRFPLKNAKALRLAFAPDGATLAVGDSQGAITLWDVADGRVRQRLTGHRGQVWGLAFSKDGKRLASSGGEDKTVRLWDPAAGRQVARLSAHQRPVTSVAFAPDGLTLASGAGDEEGGEVRLWDVATGKERDGLPGLQNVSALAFSPDGKALAVGTAKGPIHLFDLATRKPRLQLGRRETGVTALAFHSGGRFLAAAVGLEGAVRVWNPDTGREQFALEGMLGKTTSLAVAGDGQTLVVGCALEGPFGVMGELSVWDIGEHRGRFTWAGANATADNVAVSPDGQTLALPDADHSVHLIDLVTGRERRALHGHAGDIRALAFSADGQRLATADDGAAKVWEVTTGRELVTLAGSADSLTLDPRGTRLAAVRAGEGVASVTLWDVATGKRVADLQGHSAPVRVAFAPDGRTAMTASVEKQKGPPRREPTPVTALVQRWDAATGRLLGRQEAFPAGPDRWFTEIVLDFTADGQALLAAATGGAHGRQVKRWDLTTGAERTLPIPASGLELTCGPVASRDGTILVVAGAFVQGLAPVYEVEVWDVKAGKRRATMAGHTALVTSLALSPDGQTLASGDAAGAVKLWDPQVGQERLSLRGPDDGVADLRFSPDGQALVAIPGRREGEASPSVYAWTASPAPARSTLAVGDSFHLAFRPDGRSLVLTDPELSAVAAVDVITGRPVSLRPQAEDEDAGQTAEPVAIQPRPAEDKESITALSRDGLWVARRDRGEVTAVTVDGVLEGHMRVLLRGHKGKVTALAFSADAELLATADAEGALRIWEWGTGKVRLQWQDDRGDAEQLAFTADGRTLAGLGADNVLRLWDTTTGKAVASKRLSDGTECHAVAADGKCVVWCDDKHRLHFWDVRTGREVAGRDKHDGPVHSLAFAPDGRTVVSGSRDRTVQLWEVSSGMRRVRLEVAGVVHGVEFSPNGDLLAAGASIGASVGEVCLWDLSRHRPRR
jgi:WD40 repeat protein